MSNITAEGTSVQIDPIADSLKYCLVVVFNRSTSANYAAAVQVAMQACLYSEKKIDKTIIHMCAFSAEQLPLSRALFLLGYIKGFKSTKLFFRGKLLNSAYEIEEVIRCYLDSLDCNNWKAHCFTTSISNDGRRRYVVPCKRVAAFGVSNAIHYHQDIASIPDLIQAIAVKKGCNWCPNFNRTDYTEIGTKVK